MFRRHTLIALAVLLLAGAAAHPRPNWDRIWWGMSPEQFESIYPEAQFEQGNVVLPAARISRSANLANLIEPGSQLRFYFRYEGDYRLTQVTFITPHTYDEAMPMLQRAFGRQIEGEDTEANCFEADGRRRATDPSGVGHVLSLCMGAAIFFDARRGNFIHLNGYGTRPTPSDAPFQFITLSSERDCAGC